MEQEVKPSLKKNVFFNILYQLVQIGIPIALIPILSSRLQSEGSGIYAFIHSIMLYFSYFALLGVNYYGTKIIAAKREEGKEAERKAFWTIFFAKCITASISIIGYLVFCFIYQINSFVLFTQVLFLIANLIDITWFFMGSENFKSIALRNLVIKTASLILIILFVNTPDDVGLYSLILGLSEVINQLFMWFLLRKKNILKEFNIKDINKKDIFTAIKGMSLFFIPQLLIEIYTILNTTVLGIIWSEGGATYSEVGVFDYANKIVSVITTVTVSLGMVFLARISSLFKQNKKEEIVEKIQTSLYYSLFISVPLSIGIICTGHSFINWFLVGEGWSKVGIILYFLPIKAILVGISNTLGVQYLIPTGRMKHYILSVGIGAGTCIAMNFIFVVPFGEVGSAIAIVISELLVTITQIIFVRKEINVINVFKKCWKIFVAAIIMASFTSLVYIFGYNHILSFVKSFNLPHIVNLVITDLIIILASAILYISILFLLKERSSQYVSKKYKVLSHHRIVGAIGLTLVAAISISSFMYTPYLFSYKSSMRVVKRNGGVMIGTETRILESNINYFAEKEIIDLFSYSKNEFIEASHIVNERKTPGVTTYRNASEEEVAIFYTFKFEQCQTSGSVYDVILRYALKETEFMKNNIDNVMFSFAVKNIANESKSGFKILDNTNGELSAYYNNVNRDFVMVDGSINIWEQEDFTYTIEPFYKDVCYCTVGFALNDNNSFEGTTLRQDDLIQELWII